MNNKIRKPFWDNVDRSGGDDACWPWTGPKMEKGYGIASLPASATERAHRHAWRITNGDPGELCVLHRCDNRPCCNPKHLFLGTNADNIADMMRKGRQAKGAANGHAKLTAELVLMIRASDKTSAELGRELGVDRTTISAIRHRKHWAWL